MPGGGPSAAHHEHNLARLVEHVPAVVSYWDTTQHCRFCNQAGTRWWGIPHDAIVGKHASDLLGPIYRLNLPHIERVLRGEPQQFERAIPNPLGGSLRHSLINYVPDVIDGVVCGFFVMVTDVSELKQTQLALGASQAHLQQILDTAATGLTRCSRDLRYLSVNEAYAQIAGLPVDQIVDRPIVEVMGAEALSTIRPYIDRVLAGETVEYQSEVPFRVGGRHFLHVVYTPWLERNGTVSGWVGSVTDITELVAAREAAQEVARQLRQADRRKDEFLAMLSHELRNPLAVIVNVGELLMRTVPRESHADIPLQMLRRQTQQLAHLVDDLLDTARIAQGRLRLEDGAVPLDDVVDHAVETVQPFVSEKSQRLAVSKPGVTVYVRGDRARLVQCIGNILHNATKYTDTGGEIELRLSVSEQEVTIAVRDTGTGISPELLPHVFDSPARDERQVHRSRGGLGIGLALVKRLIAMHDGGVSAESSGLGQGSTFTVRLPRLRLAQGGVGETEA
jgi:PAS domain S-box-containing protein